MHDCECGGPAGVVVLASKDRDLIVLLNDSRC
jgi:hypothetical protein